MTSDEYPINLTEHGKISFIIMKERYKIYWYSHQVIWSK